MAANKVKETRVHLVEGVADILKLKRGQTIACELKQLDVLLRTNKAEPEQRFGTADVKQGESEMGIRSTTITNGKVIETYIETRPFQFNKPTEQTEEPMKHMKSTTTNVVIGGSTDEVSAKLDALIAEQETVKKKEADVIHKIVSTTKEALQETTPQPVTQVTQLKKETIMATPLPTNITNSTPNNTNNVDNESAKEAEQVVQQSAFVGIGVSWNADAALKAAADHPEAEVGLVEKKTLSEKIKGLSMTNKILLSVGATAAIAGIGFGGFKYYQNRKGFDESTEMTNTVGG
jgi:hypothetical protein